MEKNRNDNQQVTPLFLKFPQETILGRFFKVLAPLLPANIAWLHALVAFTVLLPFVTNHALRFDQPLPTLSVK